METLLLDPEDVADSARTEEVIVAVEEAFAAYQAGDVQMPAKSYIELPAYNGDFRSMPAYMDAGDWDAAGIKWVNVHTDNADEHDLPTVMGTMIYSDPTTAFPLAIMDGTTLTRQRTGAAAAVATDHLAVEDAASLGIVGAGVQSYTQLEAISVVRDIEEVVVADRRAAAVEAFVDRFSDRFDVRGGPIAEAAGCDVLSTVTPVRSPIVEAADVGDHTHINAMGADAAGKQELDPAILPEATLVIDDYEQCTHSGEINVAWSEGRIDDDDIYAEVGEIVAGATPGRTDADAGRGNASEPSVADAPENAVEHSSTSPPSQAREDGVTVFDSTGLAIQDVATAHVVYEHADEHGTGTRFDLVDTTVR
ncbi:ornithine cyclodeaminase family protein [Halobacteriales archaeon QS_4_69_225]|nr:MAG: ornithine cyclodeaminase family protein [Halobacteriales archaeon QS_4_69_225]